MLVVIARRPGTGKTTLSRRLAADLGAALVRLDAIEAAIIGSSELDPPLGPVGYVVAREVVVDAVSPVAEARAVWRAAAATADARLVMFEIVLADPAEHRRRVEQRHSDLAGLNQGADMGTSHRPPLPAVGSRPRWSPVGRGRRRHRGGTDHGPPRAGSVSICDRARRQRLMTYSIVARDRASGEVGVAAQCDEVPLTLQHAQQRRAFVPIVRRLGDPKPRAVRGTAALIHRPSLPPRRVGGRTHPDLAPELPVTVAGALLGSALCVAGARPRRGLRTPVDHLWSDTFPAGALRGCRSGGAEPGSAVIEFRSTGWQDPGRKTRRVDCSASEPIRSANLSLLNPAIATAFLRYGNYPRA